MAIREKPDYVIEYAKNKPERTEIKFIGGYYYLYERFTGYDPVKKKSIKVSGAMLGKITPEGLVPAKKRMRRHSEEPTQRDRYLEGKKKKGVDVSTIAIAETGEFGIPIPPKQGEDPKSKKVVADDSNESAAKASLPEFDTPANEPVELPSTVSSAEFGTITANESVESAAEVTSQESQEFDTPANEAVELPSAATSEEFGSLPANDSVETPAEATKAQFNIVPINGISDRAITTLNNGIAKATSYSERDDPGNAPFIASKLACVPVEKPNDNVEIGMSLFLFKISQGIYQRLESCFGHFAPYIYAIALVRTSYGPRFRRLPANFLGSIVSQLYCGLSLTKQDIANILRALGSRRNDIEKYMKGSFNPEDKLVLADGHRILSYSNTMQLAELGYDSKQRFKKQINLVYLYTLDMYGKGYPRYYQQFNGGTLDMYALKDMIHNLDIPLDSFTLVADKGCVLEEELATYDGSGLKFVLPLKRGNSIVKGKVPLSHDPKDWGGCFMFRGRLIFYNSFSDGVHNAFLYLDLKLYVDEIADAEERNKNKNNKKEDSLQKDLNKRKSDNEKAEKALTRATEARIKQETRVSDALDQFEKAKAKLLDKLCDLKKAEKKLAAMPKDSVRYSKYEKHTQKCKEDSTKALSKAAKKQEIYERELHQLIVAKNEEEKAEQNKLAAQEAVDTLIKVMDMIEHGESFDSDPDFCSKHTDVEKMFPTSNTDIINNLPEAGTITLITNRMESNAEEIFRAFKLRGNIEQSFDTYDNTLEMNATYMRDSCTMEACLFLNHLSAEMQSLVQIEIGKIGQSKNLSFKDVNCLLSKIHANRKGNTWTVFHIKEEVQNLCDKLKFYPEKYLNSFNWGNEECKFLNTGI